jgi:hypothetical protein
MRSAGSAANARTSTPARPRKLLRWLVPVGLGLLQAVTWGVLLRGGLSGVLVWYLLTSLVPLLGLLALVPAALYAAWKRSLSAALLATLVVSSFAVWPGLWSLGIAQIRYPVSIEQMQPVATVRLPSDLPLRVLWGGDRLATNYHAFYPDQRWAYDLAPEPTLAKSLNPSAYGCWGTPVVAPVTARVAQAHDGEPEALPGTLANLQRPFGNFISLELESKTYLVLAHLQPGSLLVHDGDTVQEGQPLARCGNSGHTSEPHIHIHHQRQPLDAEHPGIAEGLPLFFRDHDGAPMPEGGLESEGERVVAHGALVHHVGKAAANLPASAR